ncbi:MAG: bifunctional phosphopantothenoylcysteine decarboxylase/phosphopantothenate--cysteine ligase CoaBC [bacterium]|nr:bifunctional phosphopantothenoylcysteine decarboxylase/phosphopantothenate--cysteine ligase CoaBC [bacterium]
MLRGRRVLLGVTGSIAAYKSAYLIRLLQQQGVEVRALVTDAGKRFIGIDTLRALTGHEVYSDNFLTDGAWHENHISLAEWGDVYLLAPATANTIAGIAGGAADSLVCSTALTFPPHRTAIAPAMNTAMWCSPAVTDNVALLRRRGVTVIEPGEGFLACGAQGAGRLAEPEHIIAALAGMFVPDALLNGVRVLITAGPTREWLDDVRYISNPSTGKMGFSLARAALKQGADVRLVMGPVNEIPDDITTGTELVRVESSSDMQRAVDDRLDNTDVLIMAAAVSDYRPAARVSGKIKKSVDRMNLELVKNPDILKDIAGRAVNCVLIGFALEASDHLENARRKLADKNLEMIVLNDPTSFGSEDGSFTLLMKDGEAVKIGLASKDALASSVMKRIADILNERKLTNERD